MLAPEAASRWADALVAARLFAVDPAGLGGVALRAGPESARDLWLAALRAALGPEAPMRRVPAGIEDDRLLGGVDLVASLSAGRAVAQKGVIAEADGGVLVIPMAERLSATAAARIAGALDQGSIAIERDGIAERLPARVGVVAFDESARPDEGIPAILMDRLAFLIDFTPFSARGLESGSASFDETQAARALLCEMEPASDAVIEALVGTAAAFGIGAITAPLLALRVARAAAALGGRTEILEDDAVLAARLVLAPRALWLPDRPGEAEPPPEEPPEPPPEPPKSENERPPEAPPDAETPPLDAPSLEELLLAAVQAALPPGLLAALKANAAMRGTNPNRSGEGGAKASPLRGRPAGVRHGQPRAGSRLALVETLRAAAPWQAVRARESPLEPRVRVRRDDFRLKRFIRRRETTIVFCVDASGSTAFHRLAESKGAVELLLAEAYVARTHAALVVFRGKGADLLLPPTRSLSRARALLAELPGGGGTPLAAGLDLAVLTALGERARGREPLIVMLTDGRANIGRDGLGGRAAAAEEALASARQAAAHNLSAVFIDTSPRPREDAALIANAMRARYVALPYVEAGAVRDVVKAATSGAP